MQQAVADAMAATGAAEAVPAGWRVFRPAGDPSERHPAAAKAVGDEVPGPPSSARPRLRSGQQAGSKAVWKRCEDELQLIAK